MKILQVNDELKESLIKLTKCLILFNVFFSCRFSYLPDLFDVRKFLLQEQWWYSLSSWNWFGQIHLSRWYLKGTPCVHQTRWVCTSNINKQKNKKKMSEIDFFSGHRTRWTWLCIHSQGSFGRNASITATAKCIWRKEFPTRFVRYIEVYAHRRCTDFWWWKSDHFHVQWSAFERRQSGGNIKGFP